MDFNSTVDLIIRDLNEARDIIDDFRNYPGIPELQVELAKSKCKSAAEVIALLKNFQSPSKTDSKEVPVDQASFAKESPDVKVSYSPRSKARIPKNEVRSQKPLTVSRTPDAGIIADTFSHLPTSLNEQLGNLRDDDDVIEILKGKPLANLSEAIGVNDKFLFIRELFNGNPESYEQAIARLNDAENASDAKAIIMSYTGNKEETEASRQLLELVKRKFPADE
jgi:hypothetical protein